MRIKNYSEFKKLNEAASYVTAKTSPDKIQIAAIYDKSHGIGAIRVNGPHGIKDYKLSAKSMVYTGPIQPIKIEKTGSKYIVHTNADQKETFSQSDVDSLISLYNTKETVKTVKGFVADLTFSRTWKLQNLQ